MKKITAAALFTLSMTVLGFSQDVDTVALLETQTQRPITVEQTHPSDFKVVLFSDVTEDELIQLMGGFFPEFVVEFPAQAQIPFRFFLKGDLLNFIGAQRDLGLVQVAQTFYLRSIDSNLFLSADLVHWIPFLDFITGDLSVALNRHLDETFLGLGVDLNRR